MAQGDAARAYLESHKGDIHPATQRAPVILGEIVWALQRGALVGADEMIHNYETHGVIKAGTELCGPSCLPHKER